MCIKKKHYKISLVADEDRKISLFIQISSPYTGHEIMNYSASEPKISMLTFRKFLHALADHKCMIEVLEAIGNLIEFSNDISRMVTVYRELRYSLVDITATTIASETWLDIIH